MNLFYQRCEMSTDLSIHDYIRRFISQYLPLSRKVSKQTIKAYKIGINSFRKFLKDKRKIEFVKMSFEDLTVQNISSWLEYLKDVEHNKAATLNLRLTAIRNFMRYCSDCSAEFTSIYKQIKEIREFKTFDSALTAEIGIKYLTDLQLKLLFSLPNAKKSKGRRNRFFMILAYETGARLSELLNIKLKDIIDDNGQVRILIRNGKGGHSRYVPLPKAVVVHLYSYLTEFHKENNQEDYLFYVVHAGNKVRMDNSTAESFVKDYGKIAHEKDESFPEKLHPHMFRHSLGTALYRKGVPLPYISDLLGHKNLETTKIYSKSDISMLHQKVSEVNEDINSKLGIVKSGKLWKKEEELLLFCGLK